MLNVVTQEITLADGRIIEIETGKLARQADGAVVVKMGGTMLLATVVSRTEIADDPAFFPLSVEYREKFAAAGKIPGGFIKREGRPSDQEILNCRLVDRAIRPLFPDDYMAETQVIINLLSYEEGQLPDALGCLAASAALTISDIPFNGPVSEARVGRVNGEFVINPTDAQMAESDIDMIIAASIDNVMMVEGEMMEISEAEMIDAIKFAHEAIKPQCEAQLELAKKLNVGENREYPTPPADEAIYEQVKEALFQKTYDVAAECINDKHLRKSKFDEIISAYMESLSEEELEEKGKLIKKYFGKVQKQAIRLMMLDKSTRLDGRQNNQVRQIACEVDYLPSTHGSSVFTRGETQSLSTVTLGTKLDEQSIDGATGERSDAFYLHYNFPPFCTKEAKPIRGVSRREVGHGNLATRALKNMIPTGEENPYTIRLVSDILESNGSSSMATVCAGTMALMDAGIKIKRPVSGIAMGMVHDDSDGRYMILSDILGDEDALGDMDFKVTGTEEGITACQMDIKIDGLSAELLAEALEQAKEGRLHILGEMSKAIAEPNAELKPHAPRIVQMIVKNEYIGAIIGPGGKIIQEIQKETGTTIVIEEDEKGNGVVDIAGNNKEAIDGAVGRIQAIITEPEAGETYKGKVKSILAFGAIIEIMPGKEGLLHISEIDWKRIEDVNSIYKPGDEVEVKLLEVEAKTGKLKLSRKALLPKPEGYVERKPNPNRGGGNRGGGNRGGNGNGNRRPAPRKVED